MDAGAETTAAAASSSSPLGSSALLTPATTAAPRAPSALRAVAETVCAGVVGGSASALILTPLDVARTRLQLQDTIPGLPAEARASGVVSALRIVAANEGANGLFRGFGATAIVVPLFWATFLSLYELGKAEINRIAPEEADEGKEDGRLHLRRAFRQSAAAVGATIVADAVTNPLWLVRTRLQGYSLHAGRDAAGRLPYRGVVDAIRTIQRVEGSRALFNGLLASWMGAPHTAIHLPIYEYLTARFVWTDGIRGRSRRSDDASSSSSSSSSSTSSSSSSTSSSSSFDTGVGLRLVAASFVAKSAASICTYPFELVRTRLQDQRGAGAYEGIADCFRKIWASGGVRGIYTGFGANLVRTLPATAAMFYSYEHVVRFIRDRRILDGIVE
jgi:solute carrier family 25 folate transporter 32